MKIHYATISETGKRQNNEDAFRIVSSEDGNHWLAVALLRSHADSIRTVALMQRDNSFSLLESYHLVARQRMAAGTTDVWHLCHVGKITTESALCLVGQNVLQPFLLGQCFLVCPNLHTITSMQHGFH